MKRKKIPQKEDLVRKYGLENRCAFIRITGLGVVATDEEKRGKLIQEGIKAVKEDGVVSALMILESFNRYEISTSKIAKYFQMN